VPITGGVSQVPRRQPAKSAAHPEKVQYHLSV
jgi:hypothetical protein